MVRASAQYLPPVASLRHRLGQPRQECSRRRGERSASTVAGESAPDDAGVFADFGNAVESALAVTAGESAPSASAGESAPSAAPVASGGSPAARPAAQPAARSAAQPIAGSGRGTGDRVAAVADAASLGAALAGAETPTCAATPLAAHTSTSGSAAVGESSNAAAAPLGAVSRALVSAGPSWPHAATAVVAADAADAALSTPDPLAASISARSLGATTAGDACSAARGAPASADSEPHAPSSVAEAGAGESAPRGGESALSVGDSAPRAGESAPRAGESTPRVCLVQPFALRDHVEGARVFLRRLGVKARRGQRSVWFAVTFGEATLCDSMVALPIDGHVTLFYAPFKACTSDALIDRALALARRICENAKPDALKAMLVMNESCSTSGYGILILRLRRNRTNSFGSCATASTTRCSIASCKRS